ncbi:MAG: zinc dependent phospholipase C family protein [Acetatifactor sp.]|nr:zinc dependent phospholipase C family protein [Acetatifactor sp.]
MKSKGHVYMANVMIACLKSTECQVTFPGVDGREQYEVSPYVRNCILRYPSFFRAGSVGPDFFPDLIFGQMTIHSTRSGIWIDRMMEELKRLPENTEERQKAVSFYAGYVMHYCGDMFTHDYINGYARGWFPSYGEVIQNLFSFDVDWDAVAVEFPELVQKLKNRFPSDESKHKLQKKFPEFWDAIEKLFSIEEEKKILAKRYQELMEILGKLFSKETVQKDSEIASAETWMFLERLHTNPLTPDQLDENLPNLMQILESFSSFQEIERLKLYMPELGNSLEEVLTFDAKRKRLEHGFSGLLEAVEKSFPDEEKRKWMKKEFPELWEDIKELHGKYLLGKRQKGIEQARIIIRHVLVEKYMDDYIDEQIEKMQRIEERTLDVPIDFVRRCFASEDAFQMLEKQEPQKEEPEEAKTFSFLGYEIKPAKIKDVGFLENYVRYYSKLYEGEGTSDQNLDECNKKINTWLKIWKNIAEYALQIGTFKAFDLYGKELLFHVAAYYAEEEEKRRSLLNTMEGIDTFFGILDCDIPILSKIASDIKENVKDDLKRKLYPAILDPSSFISGKSKSELTDFDKAIGAVKERFKNVKPLLENDFLFGHVENKNRQTLSDEEIMFETYGNPFLAFFGKNVLKPIDENRTGLSEKLREEWKNLGAADQLKEIEFSPFQNACRMGYLCLMDPEQLNRLLRNYDPDFHYYGNVKTAIGIGGFIITLKTKEKTYAKGISSVRLAVFGEDYEIMQFRVGLTERCFLEEGEIRIPFPAKRTIHLEDIRRFEVTLNGNDDSKGAELRDLEKTVDCAIYDNVTNLLLASVSMSQNQAVLTVNVTGVKDDYGDVAHKAKINQIRTEIKTCDDGTDGAVHFVIVDSEFNVQDVELDKSGYNDFEAGDLDSYVIKLNVPLSIDEIDHFILYKEGGGDWKMSYVKVFSMESGDYLGGITEERYVDQTPVSIKKDVKWAKPEASYHAPIQSDKVMIKELTITIHTSDEFTSGTNDDVTLSIHYINADGKEVDETVTLDTEFHDDFEQNVTETYHHKLPGAVPLENIKYFELKKKGKDDWIIDWVKICDAVTGKQIGATEGRQIIEKDEGYVRINVN